MHCKSCEGSIKNEHKFCKHCGAKIVDERLSIKGTWIEFIGPFFNWDNNFWKTIVDLILRPHLVLDAYISGARKKYFNPFSFLIIFGTIALIFYKFFPVNDLVDKLFDMESSLQNKGGDYAPSFIVDDVFKVLFNNYNIVIILSVPFVAFISYLTFKKKGHNFSEHMVFQSYLQSMIGYVSLLLHVILIVLLKFDYLFYTNIFLVVSYIYANYVFYKYYRLKTKELLVANVKFAFYSLIFYAFVILVGVIVGVLVYKTQMS